MEYSEGLLRIQDKQWNMQRLRDKLSGTFKAALRLRDKLSGTFRETIEVSGQTEWNIQRNY